jgi:hypothetical protein
VIEERLFAPVVDEPASRVLKVLMAGGDPSKLTRGLAEAWARFLRWGRAAPTSFKMMQSRTAEHRRSPPSRSAPVQNRGGALAFRRRCSNSLSGSANRGWTTTKDHFARPNSALAVCENNPWDGLDDAAPSGGDAGVPHVRLSLRFDARWLGRFALWRSTFTLALLFCDEQQRIETRSFEPGRGHHRGATSDGVVA